MIHEIPPLFLYSFSTYIIIEMASFEHKIIKNKRVSRQPDQLPIFVLKFSFSYIVKNTQSPVLRKISRVPAITVNNITENR